LSFFLLTGCSAPPARPAGAIPGEIVELHMLTMPMALNLDSEPGADGFVVKIYAVRQQEPKPAPLKEGSVEILMYDGTISGRIPDDARPLRTWKFTATELSQYQFRTAIGIGYSLKVEWGEQRPTKDRVTIAARYLPAKGSPVTSAAHSIAVASR
jgi:hypothetical protein